MSRQVRSVDDLVVGCADLDTGVRWIAQRLRIAPIDGGVHDGFGTRNALLGLGEQYLEVHAVDPAQNGTGPLLRQVERLIEPRLLTVAIARTDLEHPVPMSRVRPDGVRLEWALQFTNTPLFFIDWKDCPRPSGLPDGGRISSLTIRTPDPDAIIDVEGVIVREGPWQIEATVDGVPLT